MNTMLKRIAIIVGALLLLVSMMWSEQGFNFDLAGDSGGTNIAVVVGWILAIAVTTVQFVFSTNFNKLNPSLITFGIIAYVYSIYTNKLGITHFQGASANDFGAWILAFVMDGVPEPLIAWGLGESLSGDFVGNILKALGNDKNLHNVKNQHPRFSGAPSPTYKPNMSQQVYKNPNKGLNNGSRNIKDFVRESNQRRNNEHNNRNRGGGSNNRDSWGIG